MDIINSLKDAASLAQMSFGDLLNGGLSVTVIGMGVTFLGLIFLWMMISFQSKLINSKREDHEQKSQQQTAVKASSQASQQAQKTQPVSQPDSGYEQEDDLELVAVITAALQHCLGYDRPFKVLNITAVDDTRSQWCKYGLSNSVNKN